jgi:hypothetical protein
MSSKTKTALAALFILGPVSVALVSSTPSAFGAENSFGRASLSSATCPVYEGYPDCHPDGSVPWSAYSSSRRARDFERERLR